MIEEYFSVYSWKIKLIIALNDYDVNSILLSLWEIGCNSKYAYEAYKNITENKINIGFTYSNQFFKKSIIFIGNQSSILLLINTISHESRHLLLHIANLYNLDLNSEEVCYLLGEIVQKIYLKLIENDVI